MGVSSEANARVAGRDRELVRSGQNSMLLCFELLTSSDRYVKHGKCAGDVEKRGSKGEMPAGTSLSIERRV